MATDKFIPNKTSAIYKAAELILNSGPRPKQLLLAEIDFGPKKEHHSKFEHAFSIGWLCETPAGTIDVTERARRYFAGAEPDDKPIGEITPAQYRPSVFASQGISKKNIPNRHGTRLDIPEWSIRQSVSFHTKA